jgi:DNA-binding transcriptional LysR family regulator
MRVEFRQLEYFIVVAEEGTFTKGARRVRVAQSAVSATIQKLERELGTPLFVREAQSTSLTEAGMALLPAARRRAIALRLPAPAPARRGRISGAGGPQGRDVPPRPP